MSELTLRCPGIESIKGIVIEALQVEEKELMTVILKTKQHLSSFEEKHNVSTEKFIAFDCKVKIDDMEAVEWEGEYEILRRAENRLKLLKEIEVCA